MEYKKYYGAVLRALRKFRGISAEKIESLYGLNAQNIYGYEQGKCIPKKNNLKILCEALRIDPNVLVAAIQNGYQFDSIATTNFNIIDGTSSIITTKNEDNCVSPEDVVKQITASPKKQQKVLVPHPRSEVEIVRDMPGEYLPVISEAAAAECNPGMMPLLDCVNQYSDEKVFFTAGRKTDFAIKVSGTSMMPWYPPKTVLLVRPYQDIQNGKRVVAVLDDGEIIFKIFARTKDNRIALMSINDQDGRDYLFPANGKGIRYICRVIQSLRNEDELDEAMAEMGVHHHWEDKLDNLNEEKGE